MTDLCVKIVSAQVPPNLKNNCDTGKTADNEIVKQLTEKAHKLKFRLLDMQNQNQMLRKELMIAKKVMRKEMPQVLSGDPRGQEEATVCLRKKIADLQKQIEQIEGTSEDQKSDETACQEDTKEKSKTSNLPRKRSRTEKLIGGCVEVKAKLEYWRNRNVELEKLSAQLHLEMDRLLEKGEVCRQIQCEYGGLERELRSRQAERLEMRSKLDIAKTRNCHLSEELAILKEDVDRIQSKTKDDKMLLEALTSQQGNFQDLIDRQRMLIQKDHLRFREDLREVHVKYTTSWNLLEQLNETTAEKDSLLLNLQDCQPLLVYIKGQADEETESSLSTTTENAENPGDPSEVEADPPSPPDPELLEECEKFFGLFESTWEEVEQMAEIAINNNKKLEDWQEQLREAKVTSACKNAELRGLQESVKTLEGLASSKSAKTERSSSTMEELLIKLDVEQEVHRFLNSYWFAVVEINDRLFHIYATGVDRTTKIFIDNLREKKKSFEKQPSVEDIGPKTSQAENGKNS